MFMNVYNLMQVDVMYDATYKLDGRACVIKKAAEDIKSGVVTCQFKDGMIIRRHYEFFNLRRISLQQSFSPPLS